MCVNMYLPVILSRWRRWWICKWVFTCNSIQVKKVMNMVYRRLRSEFSPDVDYKSSEIDSIVLSVIRVLLLLLFFFLILTLSTK